MAERSGAPGWLVLPGDMPLVQSGTLLSVATALEQYPVVYAQFKGRRGHPVGFAAELYSELIQLGGDEGARRIMARYPAFGQEVADPGAVSYTHLDVYKRQQTLGRSRGWPLKKVSWMKRRL